MLRLSRVSFKFQVHAFLNYYNTMIRGIIYLLENIDFIYLLYNSILTSLLFYLIIYIYISTYKYILNTNYSNRSISLI